MKLRWGIIGCGDIANKRVADAIGRESNSQLVAACCRTADRLSEFCSRFEIPRSYTDAEDLLGDPEIDAVYLATPVDAHHPHTLAAAAAGKHILVEKPMALDPRQCQQMIDACDRHGVKLGVAYYRRFYPTVRRLRELLADGTLGRPLAASAATGTPFGLSPMEPGYWRVEANRGGGGAIMDIGSHRIDLFIDLFGGVRNVSAFCDTRQGDWQAEDCATVMLQFECGLQATLQCFFGTHIGLDTFDFVGTDGRLSIKRLNGPEIDWMTCSGRQVEYRPPADNLNAPLIVDFVRAIAKNQTPRCDGRDGLKTNEIIARAYRAAESHRRE